MPSDPQAVLARHTRVGVSLTWACVVDGQPDPCDAVLVARALAESEERARVLEAALVTLRERIVSQRSKPWAESGSFASRMTGEEGYDEALLEVESWLP